MRARLRSRRQDERGAFAVLFAALTVMLLVLSAFTVDLGQAYVSKRQLQTAADAGVLAAGQVFIGQTMSCSQATQNAALKAQAQAAADRWA
ncbi:MAG TPA: pilus assembly protein TadG-related protein, partial [Nocardioides sp.]|nr:pilus assembly protein TadG-related protein [Nocardioides sp.]